MLREGKNETMNWTGIFFDRIAFPAATAVVSLAAALVPLQAQAADTVSISGNWAGSGVVQLQAGNKERVSCRVKYGRIAGQNFSVSARCATSGTRVDQTGQLKRISANRYIGNIRNSQFNVSARVVVTVSGQRQTVAITSEHGSANLNLRRR